MSQNVFKLGDNPKKVPNYRRWTEAENILYAQYLQEEQQTFGDFVQRKNNKVYVGLSQFIKTKTSIQFKSHHQKMLRFCGNIKQIIKRFLSSQLQIFPSSSSKLPLASTSDCLFSTPGSGNTQKSIGSQLPKIQKSSSAYQSHIEDSVPLGGYAKEEEIFDVLDLIPSGNGNGDGNRHQDQDQQDQDQVQDQDGREQDLSQRF